LRRAWALLLVSVAAGCSSDEPPAEPSRLLAASETSAMPMITLADIAARLRRPTAKATLIVLWRAGTEAESPCLAAANDLAARHHEAGLEVLAVNIDMPDDVRGKALPLLGKLGTLTMKAHAYQDDVMGLGAMLDYTWGGHTPAAYLYDRRGKQLYKGRGGDAVAEAGARVPAALAARR